MKIVIVAAKHDNHAAPVAWALERAGYEVRCWAGLGWTPERQASISLASRSTICLGPCELEAGDVVWIRRPQAPVYNPNVSEADRKFAQAEYRWFSDSVLYLLEQLPIRCVNPYSALRTIRNKAVQLYLAQACGLRIPETLMSNVPGAVRDRIGDGSMPAICKAFFPHIWQHDRDGSVAVTETFRLTQEMLPADEVLTYAPAIYQQMVDKAFDVRTLLLGTAVYSFALYNPEGSIDWRQDVTRGRVRVESIATPDDVRRRILAFAERSGIVFGSLDFGVDRDGRWWFFEVNEQGQFLWLDDFNRDLHVQEKFLAFLTSPAGASQETIEERQALFASWQDYLDSQVANDPVVEESGEIPEFVSNE